MANADGTSARQITNGDEEHWRGRRTAGGSHTSPATARTRQLFVDGRQVTRVNGFLAEPAWSPDGKSIAFLFIENAKRAAGPLVAMSRAVGAIEEHIDEQRVAIVDVATEQGRASSRPPTCTSTTSTGRRTASASPPIAAPGSGDNNYWIAQLHVVDVAAATMQPIYKPQLQIAESALVAGRQARSRSSKD